MKTKFHILLWLFALPCMLAAACSGDSSGTETTRGVRVVNWKEK